MFLYHIMQEYRNIAEQMAGLDEVPAELEARLAAVEAALPQKVDAYCALRREFEAEANAAKEEAKRLTALAQVRQNAADRIWKALAEELANIGLEKYRTARFNLWFQRNTPGAELEEGFDPKNLPEDYRRTKYELIAKTAVESWKPWNEACQQITKAYQDECDRITRGNPDATLPPKPILPPSPLPKGVKVTQGIGLRMK